MHAEIRDKIAVFNPEGRFLDDMKAAVINFKSSLLK